jgi:hypothetical protein
MGGSVIIDGWYRNDVFALCQQCINFVFVRYFVCSLSLLWLSVWGKPVWNEV